MTSLARHAAQLLNHEQRRARLARLSPQTRAAIRRARRRYTPSERLSTAVWTEKYRQLAGGALPGPFRFDNQPAVEGILDAFDDPRVRELWTQKSSQFGYTQGVELNIILKKIHIDPCAMLALFPKDDAGKRWNREKLEPAIRATPELAAVIDLDKRNADNTQDYKGFKGGYLQLVGANAPANIKSSDVPLVLVSEPDDTSQSVGGEERSQGDAITLGRERLKTFHDGKLVVGGTPTIEGLSQMAAGMQKTDKRRMFVACPHCGHEQHLRWEQIRWRSDSQVTHQVFGTHRPETARYACEACAVDDIGLSGPGFWTDSVKNAAIRAACKREDKGWRATAPFTGAAGFYIWDLLSVLGGETSMESLVKKFLEAVHALKQGKDGPMRAFRNNQLGLTYEIKRSAPEVEALAARALPYAEWTVPLGGLVVTGMVDVQRGDEQNPARLELLLRAWGRDMESWLVYFGIVLGNPLETSTWDALDAVLATPIRHEGGGLLGISKLAIDAGDGMTADAVLSYVRRRKHLGVYATKGSSQLSKEIFTPNAQALDVNATDRASRFGLKLHFIGTQRAKDDIDGRLRLVGTGPRRMHAYSDVPKRYWEQLTAERRVPNRSGKLVWECPSGVRNEALDCEVGALHGALMLRLGSWTEAHWNEAQMRVLQSDLLRTPQQNASPTSVSQLQTVPPPRDSGPANPFRGFSTR